MKKEDLHLELELGDGIVASFGAPESGWRMTSLRVFGHELLAGTSRFADAAQEQLPTNTGWEFIAQNACWNPANTALIAQQPKKLQANGTQQWILPSVAEGKFAVDLIVQLSPQNHALSLALRITNLSPQATTLINIDPVVLNLSDEFCTGADVVNGDNGQVYAPTYSNPGAGPCSLAVQNNAVGLALLPLAPGRTKRVLVGLGNALMSGYQRKEPKVEWFLGAHESFYTEPTWICLYQSEMRSALHQLVRTELRNQPVHQPLTYCSWIPFMEDIDEERLVGQMEHAAALGFEVFLIDGGWETGRRFGERTFDPERFPGGLSHLRHKAEELGLSLGLWTTLNALHKDSPRERGWEALDESGNVVVTNAGFNASHSMCLLSGYDEVWLRQVRKLVAEGDLRYIKIDFPLAYDLYMNFPVVCHTDGHYHRIPGEYTLRAYRTALELVARLQAEFPQLIVDLTYEVWGKWLTADAALVAGADVCWLSNLDDDPRGGFDGPRAARLLAEECSHSLPVEHLVCGNLRCDGPDGLRSFYAVAGSFPMLLGDLSKVSDETKAALATGFETFIQLRTQGAFDGLYTPLIPIAPYEAVSQRQWGGYLRCNESGQGLLAVFRDSGIVDSATLKADSTSALAQTYPNGILCQPIHPELFPDPVRLSADELINGFSIELPATRSFAAFTVQPL